MLVGQYHRLTTVVSLELQSMTYHPPAPEGATQIGGSSNLS
ncbi:MAG: hypothetical protein RM021_004605 [Nostoc sp. EkiNYC01]|nr:hypothetical protein [Nostoc sp. EkiNYC01]